MRRSLTISFLLILLSTNSSAQHLIYSTFMQAVRMNKLSSLTQSLSNKGYVYAGCRDLSNCQKIVWTNNCIDFSFNSNNEFKWEWETGFMYSVLIAYQFNTTQDYMEFEYYFNSKNIYNSFISGAKKDGFSYYGDSIDNNGIISQYAKVRKKSNTIELIWFSNRKGGGFFIKYFRPFPINNLIKSEESSNNTNSKSIQHQTNSQYNFSTKEPKTSGLEGFYLEYFPRAKCPGTGTVIVRVTVSPSGHVTNASIDGGSNNNSKAREICLNLAKKARFRVPKNQTIERTGTLTYITD